LYQHNISFLHVSALGVPLAQRFNTEWKFTPADAKWYNGATEALVKSIKRALSAAIGVNILTFSELQTCVFEAAELVNERPIGAHPESTEEGVYLCPMTCFWGEHPTLFRKDRSRRGPRTSTNSISCNKWLEPSGREMCSRTW
jgi:hypothetical protein